MWIIVVSIKRILLCRDLTVRHGHYNKPKSRFPSGSGHDVSRWGRFQDADESACYEFLCRRAGVNVVYCAEPFANDLGIAGSLLKSLKRAMAGECSRELSAKVFAGQCRLVRKGYKPGGKHEAILRALREYSREIG